MADGIQSPDLRSMRELFSGDTVFRVPKYQRNFAWTRDEVQDLWEDIQRAMEDERGDYFLGTIVLQHGDQGAQEIIDGQQRLACLSMIFSAVRHIFASHGNDLWHDVFRDFMGSRGYGRNPIAKPKLELNRLNNEVYRDYVFESKSSWDVSTALTEKKLERSNVLLLDAYRYILDQIGRETTARGQDYDLFLEKLINCVGSVVKLIVIPVTSEEDAYIIFESLNARGKELAVSDLVKNRLYSQASQEVDRAQNLWESMEIELGRRSLPEYLRHYWIAKGISRPRVVVREKDLYREVTRAARTQRETMELLKDLRDSARHYAMIEDATLWPDEPQYNDATLSNHIDELRLFRVSQCYPVLLNAIQVFRAPDEVVDTFRIIANFSFRYNIIGNGTSGDLERIFAEIAVGIKDGVLTSSDRLADQLRGYNNDTKFSSDFQSARMRKSQAKLARYVLAKLNRQMSRAQEQIVNPDAKNVNLEHILPQSLEPAWRSQFPTGIDPAEYVDRIGNLTLLLRKRNAEAGDEDFLQKQRIAFRESTLPINDFVKKATKWTNEEIDRRQRQLASIALEAWKL